MSDDWKNNPRLSGMDPQKLSMLQGLADQGLGKNPSELLPFIMGAASKGKNAGLNFSSDEISTIIEVLKMGKSPAEAAKLDRIVNLMKMIRQEQDASAKTAPLIERTMDTVLATTRNITGQNFFQELFYMPVSDSAEQLATSNHATDFIF